MRRDVECVVQRDPAARSSVEVALLYPGVHAVWGHRLSHRLWQRRVYFPARALAHVTRLATGIEIHPAAVIGEGVFIDHGAGVVIGETATVGEDVTIYHGVTLGGTGLEPGKRHPDIGDRVTIGAGAKVLGDLRVGHDSRIGANSVVVRSVEDNSVVVGVPGQVIARSHEHTTTDKPDLDNARVPDPVGATVTSLLARVRALESTVLGDSPRTKVSIVDGVWECEDFSI